MLEDILVELGKVDSDISIVIGRLEDLETKGFHDIKLFLASVKLEETQNILARCANELQDWGYSAGRTIS